MKNKKRKIDRKHLIHTFVFALFCVFGLTVAYAALATTLNISGSAQVASSDWDISIEKVDLSLVYGDMFETLCQNNSVTCGDNYLTKGSATIDKFPTLTDTSIKDFSVSATLPGDQVLLFYGVTNKGTIPAKLDSIDFSSDAFSGDSDWFFNNSSFDYLLKKGLNLSNASLSVGDIICPGETKLVMISFGISENATTVPSEPIVHSNMSNTYTFVQDKLTSCPA